MKKLEVIFATAIVSFVVFVVGAGALYYNYSATVMRFPYVVGGFIIVLAVWRIFAALAAPPSPATPPHGARADTELSGAPTAQEESAGEILVTGLWLVSILPAVWIFGYLAGIPLYLLVYFRAHGERWVISIVLALAALAMTYFAFILLLKVRLPMLPIGFS